MKNTREVWEAAVRRLVKRRLRSHPEMTPEAARRWAENRHEEIGAEMDAIEGKRPLSERPGA